MVRRAADVSRRDEILAVAADLFGRNGYMGTSLKDIANACGLQAGSLYHHFGSKEAVLVELMSRYQQELDGIGRAALEEIRHHPARPLDVRLLEISRAIIGCAMHHRAAAQLTFYEPQAAASSQLVELVSLRPEACTAALREVFRSATSSGAMKVGINLAMLAEHVCRMMLLAGLSLHGTDTAGDIGASFQSILLHGISLRPESDATLDNSEAMQAAKLVVQSWAAQVAPAASDKAEVLRSAARAEFARHGYESTTIRNIASALGTSNGTIYDWFESKEALLASIMDPFYAINALGYSVILVTRSTVTEKLAALAWFNMNVIARYNQDFRIQLGWLRMSPTEKRLIGAFQEQRVLQVNALLAQGVRTGEIRAPAGNPDLFAACVSDLLWVPPDIVEKNSKKAVIMHSRRILLWGIGNPSR